MIYDFKNKIQSLIKNGEGITLEFKECKNKVTKSLYETICAFLNRYGGEILLGVTDQGEITGIDDVESIKKEIISTIKTGPFQARQRDANIGTQAVFIAC